MRLLDRVHGEFRTDILGKLLQALHIGNAKTESNFMRTGPMTEAIMLGNIAVRIPDTELRWDAAAGRMTNVEEANKLLGRTYREGWNIPGVG